MLLLAWGLVAALLLVLIHPAQAQSPSDSRVAFPVGDTIRMNVSSDEPRFADPAYDDRSWAELESLAEAGAPAIPARRDVIWLRFAFETPVDWQIARPAIALGSSRAPMKPTSMAC